VRLLFLASILVFACGLALTTSHAAAFFEGTIVAPPAEHLRAGWVYVLGRNRSVRAVDVSRAELAYDDSVPKSGRCEHPAELPEGAQVEVEAEINDAGEWIASRVQVLSLPVTKSTKTANPVPAD
jgi:hypothetical protein